MEWDKFSEKALLKFLPIFLIINSIYLLWKDLKQRINQTVKS